MNPQGISTRTIDMHVARLREKLRDDPEQPAILLTVRGKGYKFALGPGKPNFDMEHADLARLAAVRRFAGGDGLVAGLAEPDDPAAGPGGGRRAEQAGVEENVRLALWRMDSSLAPLVGLESCRALFRLQHVPAGRPGVGADVPRQPGRARCCCLRRWCSKRRRRSWSIFSSSPTAA